MKTLFFTLLSLLSISSTTWAKNLQIIDSDDSSGFALYRMGTPDRNDMKEICSLGIQEIVVLSGDAQKHEEKYKDDCPGLRVVLNIKQDEKVPVTKEFIEWFDTWIQQAQYTGKKVAFRCSCGCHRTGRLAAYYQMKYQRLTAKDANAIMKKHGKWMFLYPSLDNQVVALEQHLKQIPCTEGKYCVRSEPDLLNFVYNEKPVKIDTN